MSPLEQLARSCGTLDLAVLGHLAGLSDGELATAAEIQTGIGAASLAPLARRLERLSRNGLVERFQGFLPLRALYRLEPAGEAVLALTATPRLRPRAAA